MSRVQSDASIPTRESLLGRLKDWGDQQSWRVFFDTYWRLIYGLALKCGLTDAEAQDVVQETLLAVAKQMPGFKYDPAKGSFKGWLLTITRRRIADQFRKRLPLQTSGRRAEDPGRAGPEPNVSVARIPDPHSMELDALWDAEWRQHALATALGRMKRRVAAKTFQMFDLYVMQQWPLPLVCETLDVNAAQVYMAKLRVGRMLTREIRELDAKGI